MYSLTHTFYEQRRKRRGIRPQEIKDELLPPPGSSPQILEKLLGVNASDNPSFILLSDPFTFRLDGFINALDELYPASIKLGGLASGANALLFSCSDRFPWAAFSAMVKSARLEATLTFTAIHHPLGSSGRKSPGVKLEATV